MFIRTQKLCTLFLCIAFVFLFTNASAQTDSTAQSVEPKISASKVEKVKKDTAKKNLQMHSPRKATILSAVFPGAGQIYNQKYWKLPIVYGALGAVGYLGYKQQDSLNKINRDFKTRFDNDSTTFSTYQNIYSDQQMLTAYDATIKKRDLFFVVAIALYALQIVDANVDAHLFYFDVSDDLSLKFTPEVNRLAYAPSGSYSTGVRLTIKFK